MGEVVEIHGSSSNGSLVMTKSNPKEAVEFHPDAMERFERAVKVVAKAPPQHRATKQKPTQKRPSTKRKGLGK